MFGLTLFCPPPISPTHDGPHTRLTVSVFVGDDDSLYGDGSRDSPTYGRVVDEDKTDGNSVVVGRIMGEGEEEEQPLRLDNSMSLRPWPLLYLISIFVFVLFSSPVSFLVFVLVLVFCVFCVDVCYRPILNNFLFSALHFNPFSFFL